MPTSQQYQISKIVDVIVHLNPNSVLDIGTGFGKYGLLCREYLELWDGREDYRQFNRTIEGIEIFEQYLTPVHSYVYCKIHVGNACDVVPKLTSKYDLTLLIDVLEHFEKDQGTKLIKDILKISKNLIISVPKDIGDQGTVFENKHEAHIAEWDEDELLKLANGFSISDRMSHIVFLSQESDLSKLKRIFSPGKMLKLKRGIADALR